MYFFNILFIYKIKHYFYEFVKIIFFIMLIIISLFFMQSSDKLPDSLKKGQQSIFTNNIMNYYSSNSYPVWYDYQIPDVESPYKVKPIHMAGWIPLQYLRGIGSLYLINRVDHGQKIVYDRGETGSNNIDYASNYITNKGSISFDQLHFSGFDAETLEKFKYAFWYSGNRGNPNANTIKNYASRKNIYGTSTFRCWHPGLPYIHTWVSNMDYFGEFSLGVHSEQSRFVFVIANLADTPQSFYDSGAMCAESSIIILDRNLQSVHRVTGSGAGELNPYRYYPLNSHTKGCDYVHSSECGVTSNVNYVNDRFGREREAMSFAAQEADIGYTILPQSVFDQIRKTQNFTLAFWVKKDPKSIMGKAFSYYPSFNDHWSDILWGTSDQNGADFGLALHNYDNLGHSSSGHFAFSQRTKIGSYDFHWKQWLESPVRLVWDNNPEKEISPWTFVVLVYKSNETFIYIFNEKIFSTGALKGRVTLRRFTYNSTYGMTSSLAKIAQWGIGKTPHVSPNTITAIEAIDEFTVFDSALSESQIHDLLNAQIVDQMPQIYSITLQRDKQKESP